MPLDSTMNMTASAAPINGTDGLSATTFSSAFPAAYAIQVTAPDGAVVSSNAGRLQPPDVQADLARLTPRSRRAVEMAAAGLSNKRIALAMDCAEATVKTYLRDAFGALGLTRRVELPAWIAGEDPSSLRHAATVKVPGLSERESEVLRLIAAGLSNEQITVALEISSQTVKVHAKHILKVLRADNRSAAAAAYVRLAKGEG